MLIRGRGAKGFAGLKQAVLLEDIELVLNPGDHDPNLTTSQHVTITCDGPLTFDYEQHIATFEQNVHVKDPNGDLYSDKLIAYLDQVTRTIRYAEAIGRVRIVQHANIAHSDRAIYEPNIGKITLVGKPSLLVYPSEGNEPSTLSFSGLAGGTPKRE
jgi:lipopolysaccharide assembly outer membrane protein LptD (OstA)